jgi:hypothetical protein
VPVASVIPNRRIIFLSLETDLRIMVLRYEVDQIAQQEIRFILGYAIDPHCETFVHKHRLPSSDSWF